MAPGLPRLKPSQRVSCTNSCTNLVPDLLVSLRFPYTRTPIGHAAGTPHALAYDGWRLGALVLVITAL